jgi:hypothetical protein
VAGRRNSFWYPGYCRSALPVGGLFDLVKLPYSRRSPSAEKIYYDTEKIVPHLHGADGVAKAIPPRSLLHRFPSAMPVLLRKACMISQVAMFAIQQVSEKPFFSMGCGACRLPIGRA